ncbi:MAG: hypothetical protein ACI9CD_000204 [Candidatus Deianiraeaceae bacterium]
MKAFQIICEEQKLETQVEVKEGSIELCINVINCMVVVATPLLTYALNKPKTTKQKEASNDLFQVVENNFYGCTINEIAINPQPFPSKQTLHGVEYKIKGHDLEEKIKTHFDENNNSAEIQHIEKIKAFIEIASGELSGKRFPVQTTSQYIDREATYIASFEYSSVGNKLYMIDKPMLIS